jgi:hypothetical protein
VATAPPDLTPTLILLVIFALFYARRVVVSITGTVLSVGRLVGFSAFYGVLFVAAVVQGFTLLPDYLLGVDAAVAVGAAFLGELYVRGRVDAHERTPGVWIYRLSPIVPLVYLALFVVRLLLDLFVLNLDPFVFTLTPPPVASQVLWILAVVNLLFALSTGLLLGRNVAVYRAYEAKLRAAASSKPLSST